MSNNDIKEEIDLLTKILETDARLKELNSAKDYLNSTFYWKRYNELVELKQFLLNVPRQ